MEPSQPAHGMSNSMNQDEGQRIIPPGLDRAIEAAIRIGIAIQCAGLDASRLSSAFKALLSEARQLSPLAFEEGSSNEPHALAALRVALDIGFDAAAAHRNRRGDEGIDPRALVRSEHSKALAAAKWLRRQVNMVLVNFLMSIDLMKDDEHTESADVPVVHDSEEDGGFGADDSSSPSASSQPES